MLLVSPVLDRCVYKSSPLLMERTILCVCRLLQIFCCVVGRSEHIILRISLNRFAIIIIMRMILGILEGVNYEV